MKEEDCFMVMVHTESVKSMFKGTVIDIETIGDFCNEYQDSRMYQELTPVIFGYIDKDKLRIHYIKTDEDVRKLKFSIARKTPYLSKPLYAFNCDFEHCVLYHSWGTVVNFDGELNKEKYEPKWQAVASLGIPNYNDPFHDNGRMCMESWRDGNIALSIKHNRSCLLKERDILLKRGYRKPDHIELKNR